MENEEQKFEFNYGIIAVDKREVANGSEAQILHFCGYPNEPTTEDYQALFEELSKDTTFGLSEMMDHIQLLEAPTDIVETFKLMFDEQHSNE